MATLSQMRWEAAKRGDTRFTPGIPCRNGHNGERYVSSGQCVECDRDRKRKESRALLECMRQAREVQEA